MLNSFTGFKENHIPLSFILVALLFLGKEVINAFETDRISQFAHIAGGIAGSYFGYILNERKSKSMSEDLPRNPS
jgi:membrane associated rhomboid family serine protease